jgi:hypothetical protein
VFVPVGRDVQDGDLSIPSSHAGAAERASDSASVSRTDVTPLEAGAEPDVTPLEAGNVLA